MIKILISFIFVFLFKSSYAQTSETSKKSGLSETEFLNAKENYLKIMETKVFQDYERYSKILAAKTYNAEFNQEDIETTEAWTIWLSKNFSKTSFTSTKDAIDLRNLTEKLLRQLLSENEEFYAVLKQASAQQIYEIFKPYHERSRNSLWGAPKP